MIYNIIRKLRCMGLVPYIKKSRKRHVLTEEKLDGIGTWLEASLKKSLHPLAFQCELAKSTAYIGTKLVVTGLQN
jgi:hypothetical protein